MLIDTHAHLSFPQFSCDLDNVIQNAKEAGVTTILNIGTNLEVTKRALSLAEKYEGIYATAGFHPQDVEKASTQNLELLSQLLLHDRIVGVGETGLDFYRDYAPRDLQERIFQDHIGFALEKKLPLVIHSRGAEDRVLDILEAVRPDEVNGVLHCFGGNSEQAKRAVDLNFYIGFGGTVTFPKSISLSVALKVPKDRMLLETDCPYLAPLPYRGNRNEPANVKYVAKFLAREMGESYDRFLEQTMQNAFRLFKLLRECENGLG